MESRIKSRTVRVLLCGGWFESHNWAHWKNVFYKCGNLSKNIASSQDHWWNKWFQLIFSYLVTKITHIIFFIDDIDAHIFYFHQRHSETHNRTDQKVNSKNNLKRHLSTRNSCQKCIFETCPNAFFDLFRLFWNQFFLD